MILVNKDYNTVISDNLTVADTYFKRLKGLMFTKELPSQNALQIIPCSEIHTFFMNYSIDVLYLDGNNSIVYMDEKLQPRKVGKYVKNAKSVIELPEGKIKEADIKVGQTVQCIKRLK